MPDQTRASTISSIASEKRVKLLVKPPLFVSVQEILSVPKKSWSVATNEPLRPECPDGCSAYGGVPISGSQPASFAVSGFSSVSASRIAVMGRQKDQYALSSQTLISASAADTDENP